MTSSVGLLAAGPGTPEGLASEDSEGRHGRAALQTALGLQRDPEGFGVPAGDGGQAAEAGETAVLGRFAEVSPQVEGRKVVGLGQADDEGPDALAGLGPDQNGQEPEPLVVQRTPPGLRNSGASAATSRGTASSPALVIFSEPSRIASIAAPRTW